MSLFFIYFLFNIFFHLIFILKTYKVPRYLFFIQIDALLNQIFINLNILICIYILML